MHPGGALRVAGEVLDELRRMLGRFADAAGFRPLESACRIAAEWPPARLRAYQDRNASTGPVVLIVPAPVKRPYIWDLLPEVSVVAQFRARRMRVYLLEWRPATNDIDECGLADYASAMPAAALDVIESETGIAAPILAGNSLGGTFAAIFATLFPERVRGLILVDAPLVFGPDGGPLADATKSAPHAGGIRAALGGPIPGALINMMSVAAAPDEFQTQRVLDLVSSLADAGAFSVHARVERWALNEVSMAGRLFEDTVEILYRNNCLVHGTLEIAGRVTSIGELRTAVMAVVNRASRVVPPPSILLGLEASSASSVRILEYRGECGPMIQHVGPLVGPRAHALLWPPILDWTASVANATSRP